MKKLVLALLIVFLPLSASAAIVRDNSAASATSGTSLTYSHTVAGSNRALVVAVGTGASAGGDVVTGVTYNGVAMTRINTVKMSSDAQRLYLYYLNAPSTGTNDVVISASASGFMDGKSVSYTGVSQTGQPETQGTSQTAGNQLTTSNDLTPTTDNSVHVAAFAENACRAGGTVSNSTLINRDFFACGASAASGLYESNPLLITPAALHTMTMTVTPAEQMISVGLTLAPAAGGGGGATPRLWHFFPF